MDISALQQRLRQFAADRDWQPYQTPKNLAMAMTVEAAELLEIFQWLTPEQSRALTDAQRQHLGEELSDVLLYLLQIADHAGVDLEAAVERKLALNAVKHPPLRS
jgi:NTP pyrophosphatase (non-canonical NTP hydrolase)